MRASSVAFSGFLIAASGAAAQDKTVTITSTGTMVTQNPYADSATQMNSIWCQVYGCLIRYDNATQKFAGHLVENWENVAPDRWRFTLRDDLERHDGGPGPTSADVVHSWKRILEDPESQQRHVVSIFEEITPIDERTFEIRTSVPDASLVSKLSDRFIITSGELYDQHGAEADAVAPHGWGPFELEEYAIDNRIVLSKFESWDHAEGVPGTVIYQQMREPSQRVTAILNGEVQIARMIPPELMSRFEGRDDIDLVRSDSIELMFMALNPNFEPWDNPKVRQAAAHAINRDLIIDRLLGGLAQKQDGPVGPNQVCYTGPADDPREYDPERARELLAEAGFGDGGPTIDFYTANGRYISDRQIGQVIASMLEEVGFDVTFHSPEWANLWSEIRTGKTPAYYMGRGSVLDPSQAVTQYFGTGETPRIGYSNPELDVLLEQEKAAFDDEERCNIWREINQMIIDETPAHFLWTYTFVTAVPEGLEVKPLPSGEIWLSDIRY